MFSDIKTEIRDVAGRKIMRISCKSTTLNNDNVIIEQDVTNMSNKQIKKIIDERILMTGEMFASKRFSEKYDKEKSNCDCDKCINGKKFMCDLDLDGFMEKIEKKSYYDDLTKVFSGIMKNADFDRIKQVIENIKNDDDTEIYFIIAEQSYIHKDKEKMEEYYLKFLKNKTVIDSKYIRAMTILGIHYFKETIYDKSGEYLKKSCDMIFQKIDCDTNKAFIGHAFYYYGKYFEEINDENGAVKQYIISADSGNTHAIKKLATIYVNKEDNIQAIKYINMLLNIKNYTMLLELCDIYKKQKDYVNMIKILTLGEENNMSICTLKLGEHYMRKRLYNKAISKFNKIKGTFYSDGFPKEENFAEISLLLGSCYNQKRKMNKYSDFEKNKWSVLAKTNYDNAIFDGKLEVIYRLVEILMEEKDYENCELYCKYGIEKEYIKSYLLMGLLHRNMNNHVKMKYYFELGIEKGDLECACAMGDFYDKNNDNEKMVFYYDLVKDDNLFACVKLGYHFGINNDTKKVSKYYKILCNKHNIIA